jgi:hypothetical protein
MGDELHMLAECEEYTPVRRSHAHLFADFGGWAEFPREGLTAEQFRLFMHQSHHQVAAFLHECAQRRWQDPPVDVLYADGLSAAEAEALWSGGLSAEESSQYYSATSDDFFEVYSDAFYDVTTP